VARFGMPQLIEAFIDLQTCAGERISLNKLLQRVRMLDHTDQDKTHARGKTRPDLEHAPHRALNMYVSTPAAKDITERCLGRILLWEAEQRRRGRSTADIGKLKDCTAAFLGALFSVPHHAWFRTAMENRIFTGKLSKHSWRTVHAVRDALVGCGLMEQQDAVALVLQEMFDSGQKHAKERRQTRFRATSTLYALADAAGVRVNAADGDQDFVSGPPAPLRLLTSDRRPVNYGDDPRAAIEAARLSLRPLRQEELAIFNRNG
jgi:hypothetical protein